MSNTIARAKINNEVKNKACFTFNVVFVGKLVGDVLAE